MANRKHYIPTCLILWYLLFPSLPTVVMQFLIDFLRICVLVQVLEPFRLGQKINKQKKTLVKKKKNTFCWIKLAKTINRNLKNNLYQFLQTKLLTTSSQCAKTHLDTVLKELDTSNGTSPQTYTPCSTYIENTVTKHRSAFYEQPKHQNSRRYETITNINFIGSLKCAKSNWKQISSSLQCMHN